MIRNMDAAMPWLESALDSATAESVLRDAVSLEGVVAASLTVQSVRLMRRKPGRRAVLEYVVEAEVWGTRERFALVGKIRAKGLDNETVRVVSDLRAAGFHDASPDRISVPEIAGIVPGWRMWLSRKAEGRSASECLRQHDAQQLASRIPAVTRKLHRSGVSSPRQHSLNEELAVLDSALAKAIEIRPDLISRIEEVGSGCHAVASSLPSASPGPIHRDFYADQVIVSGDRLYVIDLDLFSCGDPELDIGNFVAHVTEQALRVDGYRRSMDAVRRAIYDSAVATGASREAILAYELLSLARHIWISVRIPERRHLTEAVLAECERRLARSALEVEI